MVEWRGLLLIFCIVFVSVDIFGAFDVVDGLLGAWR